MTLPEFTVEDAPPPAHITPDHKANKPKRRGAIFNRDESPHKTVTVKERVKEPPSKPGEFVKPLTEIYRALGIGLMPFSPQVAMTILAIDEDEDSPHHGKDRATICAESLDEAAQTSDGLRRTLRLMTKGGTWGKVIMAHAPILLAVMVNHTPIMGKMKEGE